jgi:serine/threonine-protein kinase
MTEEAVPIERPEIPGYRVLSLLGEGGCARVWLAEDVVSGRRAAVKVLSGSAPQEERNRVRGWEDSVRLVRHPNLTRVLGLGETDGRPYLIMEHVRGRPLDRRVDEDGPLSEAEAIDLAAETAGGLREAARNGLVHGDVKPGNLLIDGKGRTRICDLGFARPGAERVGTPFYMAPEQIRGDAEVDARADMYALGLTLYFAVTGDPPFPGDDVRDVLRKQLECPLGDPRTKRGGLSGAFVRIVLRLAAKDPDDRYADWDAVLAEIETLREDAGPVLRVVRTVSRLASRPLVRLAVLLTIVTAVVALVVLAIRDDGGDDGTERRRLAAEAEARGALEQIDRELARGESDAIDEFRRLREFVTRYPGTDAAVEALARARALEKRLTKLREERFTAAMRRARELERACAYDRAKAILEEQRRVLSGSAFAEKLRLEAERIEGTARAKREDLARQVDALIAAGRKKKALAVLDAAPHDRAGGLGEWIRHRRDDVELLPDDD